MKDINLMDLLLRSTIDKTKALGLLSSRKVIVDSTHTLSVFKRYTLSEVIVKRSHELLLVIKESGISQKFYSRLPNLPASKATNLMIEYAKALLLSKRQLIIFSTSFSEGQNPDTKPFLYFMRQHKNTHYQCFANI